MCALCRGLPLQAGGRAGVQAKSSLARQVRASAPTKPTHPVTEAQKNHCVMMAPISLSTRTADLVKKRGRSEWFWGGEGGGNLQRNLWIQIPSDRSRQSSEFSTCEPGTQIWGLCNDPDLQRKETLSPLARRRLVFPALRRDLFSSEQSDYKQAAGR